MGDDGARGMKLMKDEGAFNYAQNEASSLVFGMPKVAIEHGGVDQIESLENIAKALLKYKL
jgi:two-component system chemotaxis response regulator CheB